MSAGSGIRHSEINQGDETVHLYQIWIMPREEGLTPRHEERDFASMRRDVLVPVASGYDHDALRISADAVIYRGIFDEETLYTHMVHTGTGNVFLYVTTGSVELSSGETLEAGDQARITQIETLEMTCTAGTQIVVIDIAD